MLQLLFAPADAPSPAELERLTTFAVRAAHALNASERARSLALELERTRALLAVVGQATAELSLTHTLETAVAHVAELLAVEDIAVYLRADEDRLVPAATRGLAGPHVRVAERLLELAPRGERGRRAPTTSRATHRLRDVRTAARESGIEAALAVPLLVRNEVIGLLAVYPALGRRPTDNEAALLGALAGQLAVAVQNAQLHEQATELSRQREAALASEREAARRLGALYEISRSFAQELSLEKTLDALAQTIVDVLDVDAAVIGMPDDRGELLTPRAIHVKDVQLADAARVILWRAQPFGNAAVQRLVPRSPSVSHRARPRDTRAVSREGVDRRGRAGRNAGRDHLGPPDSVVPPRRSDHGRDGGCCARDRRSGCARNRQRSAIPAAEGVRRHDAALAPAARRSRTSPGLEVGEVYESSARVDVGGDIYDFVELDDGRLAVVLGDVTGHGVEATADMAMAKFVFRSLAREHPEPGDFLAFANDVVVDEIAPGKFITMTYVTVDPARGEVACANAGHPPPRLVLPDGTVRGLDAAGIVLGIDPGQTYEEVRTALPVGSTIVLYTDGVVEARDGGELYGTERLDKLLVELHSLPAAELARAVTEDARRYAGGELSDDLAVVVIHRRG